MYLFQGDQALGSFVHGAVYRAVCSLSYSIQPLVRADLIGTTREHGGHRAAQDTATPLSCFWCLHHNFVHFFEYLPCTSRTVLNKKHGTISVQHRRSAAWLVLAPASQTRLCYVRTAVVVEKCMGRLRTPTSFVCCACWTTQ